jgi:preprotein translocase subunit SecB
MSDQPTLKVSYKFDGFFLRRFSFRETGEPTNAGVIPPRMNVELGVAATYKIQEDGQKAQFDLGLKITGSKEYQPYEIEVDVSGIFGSDPPDLGAMKAFCLQVAPSLLYPYVREIVHRNTMDGRFGIVRLDPLDLRGALATMWGEDGTVHPPEARDESKE